MQSLGYIFDVVADDFVRLLGCSFPSNALPVPMLRQVSGNRHLFSNIKGPVGMTLLVQVFAPRKNSESFEVACFRMGISI